MNKLTSQVYRIVIPKFIRKKILAKYLPKSILKYYAGLPKPHSAEITSVLDYLSKNPIAVFPYDFQDEYIAENIEVFDDKEKGLKYVLMDGKRLYFKKRWGTKKIQNLYNLLSKEQDIRSPHRYLTNQFEFNMGETLVDVGTAEGNFALSVVDKATRIILFEADKEWIEPLNATFEPWKDKVEIVNKFVSNISDSSNTKLDDYLNVEIGRETFIKIDVEGAESRLLDGCKQFLSKQKPLKLAICTYHKQNDEKEFSSLLKKHQFNISHSDGYMLFYYDKQMTVPYFRRGLIRAEKN